MKRRYQIDREKAVHRCERQVAEEDREVQLQLPLKQIAAALQDDVGELMRQAGLELMQLIMEDEVRQLARRTLPTTRGRTRLSPGPRTRLPRRRRPENQSPTAARALH